MTNLVCILLYMHCPTLASYGLKSEKLNLFFPWPCWFQRPLSELFRTSSNLLVDVPLDSHSTNEQIQVRKSEWTTLEGWKKVVLEMLTKWMASLAIIHWQVLCGITICHRYSIKSHNCILCKCGHMYAKTLALISQWACPVHTILYGRPP